jgi:hypothetical protein
MGFATVGGFNLVRVSRGCITPAVTMLTVGIAIKWPRTSGSLLVIIPSGILVHELILKLQDYSYPLFWYYFAALIPLVLSGSLILIGALINKKRLEEKPGA